MNDLDFSVKFNACSCKKGIKNTFLSVINSFFSAEQIILVLIYLVFFSILSLYKFKSILHFFDSPPFSQFMYLLTLPPPPLSLHIYLSQPSLFPSFFPISPSLSLSPSAPFPPCHPPFPSFPSPFFPFLPLTVPYSLFHPFSISATLRLSSSPSLVHHPHHSPALVMSNYACNLNTPGFDVKAFP